MPRFVAILATSVLAMTVSFAADEVTPKPANHVLLVAPFENQTAVKAPVTYEVATGASADHPKRTFTVDRYSEAPRSILENMLCTVPGVTVVERQRVDAMLLENSFGAFSGLVDGTVASNLGRVLGAQVIVMGTILRVDVQEKKFSGYGVETVNTQVTAQIRVRSVNVATGAVLASTIVEGSKVYAANRFGGTQDSDVAYAVLDIALTKLSADSAFLASLAGNAPAATGPTAVVKIHPDPKGCDVLIDGTYRGSTPLTLTLPANTAVKIRLDKTGYFAWERTLVPAQVADVTPELTAQP
jgi:curli biogenesis system outer membrane secretion channel CsgG